MTGGQTTWVMIANVRTISRLQMVQKPTALPLFNNIALSTGVRTVPEGHLPGAGAREQRSNQDRVVHCSGRSVPKQLRRAAVAAYWETWSDEREAIVSRSAGAPAAPERTLFDGPAASA